MLLSLIVEGKKVLELLHSRALTKPCTEHSSGLFSYLQFSCSHFEHQLDDTAHGQASSTGRVHLIPNGVTVNLMGTHSNQVRSKEGSQESRDRCLIKMSLT